MKERGFTLIEMMIVVALIAILAAVVVPTFFRESNKTKAGSEVTAMFGELSTKLEQYKSDTNSYVNGDNLESGTPVECPTTTTRAGVDALATCVTSGSAWETLRIQPTQAVLRCKYEIQVGLAGDAYSGTLPTGIAFTPPTSTGWYSLLATCDGDGNGAPNAQFFISSIDSTLQKVNEGQ